MCGKFTQMASWKQVHAFSQSLGSQVGPDALLVSTPMRMANIMRLDASGQRELVPMRWGFAGKDDKSPLRPRHMHARAETIDRLPTFASAFKSARGILMVHTFNEGEEMPNGKTKQWVIRPRNGLPIAIAVVCEEWSNGLDRLDTFVQVTTPANALISRITDRMPAILLREAWPVWLGETDATSAEVKGLLQTFDDIGDWEMTEQPSTKPVKLGKLRKPDPQQTLL